MRRTSGDDNIIKIYENKRSKTIWKQSKQVTLKVLENIVNKEGSLLLGVKPKEEFDLACETKKVVLVWAHK